MLTMHVCVWCVHVCVWCVCVVCAYVNCFHSYSGIFLLLDTKGLMLLQLLLGTKGLMLLQLLLGTKGLMLLLLQLLLGTKGLMLLRECIKYYIWDCCLEKGPNLIYII